MSNGSQATLEKYSIQDVIDFYATSIASRVMSKRAGEHKLFTLRSLMTRHVFNESDMQDIMSIDSSRLIEQIRSHCKGVSDKTVYGYASCVKRTIKEFLQFKSEADLRLAEEDQNKLEYDAKLYKSYNCFCPIRGGKSLIYVDDIPCDLTIEEVEPIVTMMQALFKANIADNKDLT